MKLPLKLVIQVEATNGSTTLTGVETVVEQLKKYDFPKSGQVIETEFYRVTVLDSISTLS